MANFLINSLFPHFRLASEEGVARYVFQMGGVHRLVSLCRKDKERNYSDGVLIAALVNLLSPQDSLQKMHCYCCHYMQPSCKLTLFDLSNSDLANFLVMMTTMMQMSHTA